MTPRIARFDVGQDRPRTSLIGVLRKSATSGAFLQVSRATSAGSAATSLQRNRKRRPSTACPGISRQCMAGTEHERNRNGGGVRAKPGRRGPSVRRTGVSRATSARRKPRDPDATRLAARRKPGSLLARPLVRSEVSALGGASARGASRHRVRLPQPDPHGSESGSTAGGRPCSSVLSARHPRPPGRSIGPLGAPLESGPRCPKLALGPILRQSMPQVGRTPHPGVPSQPRY